MGTLQCRGRPWESSEAYSLMDTDIVWVFYSSALACPQDWRRVKTLSPRVQTVVREHGRSWTFTCTRALHTDHVACELKIHLYRKRKGIVTGTDQAQVYQSIHIPLGCPDRNRYDYNSDTSTPNPGAQPIMHHAPKPYRVRPDRLRA
jgi:hypothetical protein